MFWSLVYSSVRCCMLKSLDSVPFHHDVKRVQVLYICDLSV